MASNPYANKVEVNGNTIIDLTADTAIASDVASGKYFHLATGERVQGTASGGGSSAWTKIAETSYQVSTTGTSATTHATWSTGHSELWTKDKWVYVRIYDTAGHRDGYFYGTDQFFYNENPTSTSGGKSTFLRIVKRRSNSAYVVYACTATTGYGVYADMLYSDGRIRIRKRYNSTYSLTVDGTYKVEVYLLDPAGGVPIFG